MKSNSINVLNTEILSDNWYTLKKVTYDYLKADGIRQVQNREVYDRGNGATILLYNKTTKKIILTRQFRLPTYLNGNNSGFLIETCAGLLEKENPEACIIRETEEETGYKISNATKVFEAYMSPGSVTEILYFFIAAYTIDMKIHRGGGVALEQEDIEVLEINFDDALEMIEKNEIKDGKTIMLLQHLRLKNIL